VKRKQAGLYAVLRGNQVKPVRVTLRLEFKSQRPHKKIAGLSKANVVLRSNRTKAVSSNLNGPNKSNCLLFLFEKHKRMI